jgi:hypothetical protein
MPKEFTLYFTPRGGIGVSSGNRGVHVPEPSKFSSLDEAKNAPNPNNDLVPLMIQAPDGVIYHYVAGQWQNYELVRSTMAEARPDRPVNPAHVLARLRDWKERTSRLFDLIQNALGRQFTFDRTGKQQSAEEPVQRAGLSKDQVPALDILRIERPPGTLHATIIPRGLWIIGANGRLDLRVLGTGNKQTQYFLVDKSPPLSGADNAEWYIVDPSDKLEQRPLTEQVIHEVIGASG